LVEDGVTGTLTSPGDVEDIAAALVHLLSDRPLRSQMGRAARRKVLAEFDVGRNTSNLIASWEAQLAQKQAV
jgi:glycosyltransferase involved in cell wall biosynthesis